ncbi:MAG: HIT family protein [Chloroflexi bacterium]|nr:HIT family protein [Chloroflexota bacterium]
MQIAFEVKDDLARQLAAYAKQAGMTLEQFVASEIESRSGNVAALSDKTWMPRERWDALVRGEVCPLCDTLRETAVENPFGFTIADLSISRLRLVHNQFVRGYCVLICAKHVREPYELDDADRARFFDDVMRAARALDRAFQPVKLNYEILGNAIPHLHCHLKPRYYGDAAPSAPIYPDLAPVTLTPHEYGVSIRHIRAAL